MSFLDFIQILTRITSSKQSSSDMMNAFEVFDREEKGFFKLNELEQALKEMNGAQDVEEREIADILALADPDGDGHVSFQGLWQITVDVLKGLCHHFWCYFKKPRTHIYSSGNPKTIIQFCLKLF